MKEIPNIQFHGSTQPAAKGFELLRFEQLLGRDAHALDHNPFRPHRIKFNILFLIDKGSINHFIDFQTHRLKAGDCMPLFSNQIHAFDPTSTYHGHLVLFTDSFLYKNLHPEVYAYLMQTYRHRWEKHPFQVPELSEQLLERLENAHRLSSFRNAEIGAALSSFYTQLFSEASHVPPPLDSHRTEEIFIKFNHLIEVNLLKSRSASYYADLLGVSYKHLNDTCKRYISMSAKQYIDEVVILEAKRLLATQSLSIKEISYKLGFDEQTNFQKYFKKRLKMTPLQFQAKNS
ncbi:MAG: AraC family transcriptional regulator [Bacteroidia bacterium]|nr:AraC family transcriptional regulator [Bacteroidia bacterium]